MEFRGYDSHPARLVRYLVSPMVSVFVQLGGNYATTMANKKGISRRDTFC